MPKARLAKITRPRLHRILPRERLFRLLDDKRRYPIVWLAAAPGAGKTTLIASYLQERALPGIWYQIDSGDSDPSTFFYYLGLAALKGRSPLPLLTPEYLPDLAGFTRRYFRALFARMPRSSVVVLDNYQEAPETSPLQAIVEEAASQIPDGLTVFAISRNDPPRQFARFLASDRLSVLDWQDLRLTLEETEAIATLRGVSDRTALSLLHRYSDGWAAGLTLLLERMARNGVVPQSIHAETNEAVFNYFAGEIFDKTSIRHQQVLLATAFLPRITADVASKISGQADAGKLLEHLYRRHLFTDRRAGTEIVYQYHALFREFLVRRARDTLAPATLMRLMQRGAQLLEDNGQSEDAIRLYLDARNWDAAIRLIIEQAPELVAQGRGQTLCDWIDLLPQDRVQAAPWLLYWLGTWMIGIDQLAARCKLASVLVRFELERNSIGQVLAISRIIETYYFERSKLAPLDQWIEKLGRLLPPACEVPSPETELRAQSAMLVAAMYRQPGHRLLAASAARIVQLLQIELDPDLRVSAGTFLLNYCSLAEDFERGPLVIALVQPLIPGPGVTPLSAITWWSRLGFYRYLQGECEAARDCLDEAHRISRQEGIHFGDGTLFFFQTLVSIDSHDLAAAQAHARELEHSLKPARITEIGYSSFANGVIALLAGDHNLALRHGNAAIALGRDTGSPYMAVTFRLPFLYALADSGDHETALALVREARALMEGTYLIQYSCELLFVEAYSALLRTRVEEAQCFLREGFTSARRRAYAYQFRWLPKVLARLCSAALEYGIETDYVKCVIRRHAVAPESRELEAWPWPIKVYTLSRFAVLIDDNPVQFRGKTQRKPMDLLRAMIALGGRDVASSALIRCLWPDVEGDIGRNLFDTTLHRLRRLLGYEDAVTIQDAKVSLNPLRCWVDAWGFERLERHMQTILREAGLEAVERVLEQTLHAYPGHFLPNEPDTAWVLGTRERLRSKFLRLVSLAGRHWEKAGRWEHALSIYQRALEMDPLAEELYRAAMLCHLHLRHPADGIELYRRCRAMLSVTLGLQPCSDTQAVYRSLRQG